MCDVTLEKNTFNITMALNIYKTSHMVELYRKVMGD